MIADEKSQPKTTNIIVMIMPKITKFIAFLGLRSLFTARARDEKEDSKRVVTLSY